MADEAEAWDDLASEKLSEKGLQRILQSMLAGIESSKSELYDVYEAARREVEQSRQQLEEVRRETQRVIGEVDGLVREEQKEKKKFAHVSAHFADYSEAHIREAYDAVRNVQVLLGVAREREQELRRNRNRLEVRCAHLQKVLQGAERLAMRISSMLNFFGSSLSDLVLQLETASKNRLLSAAIIRAQEEERLRVSREIHDGPAQDVANVLLEASICERLVDVAPDEAKMNIQTLRRHLKTCLVGIRQIIFDMRPMALDDLGLVAAVEMLAQQLERRGLLAVTMTVEGVEAPLAGHVKTALFRIVQEALGNAAHHAKVKRASLRMLYTDTALSILIEDEGEGFDAERIMDQSGADGADHFGLFGMRERAMSVGAQFSIASQKGHGTRIHVRFPMKLKDAPEETPKAEKRKRPPRKRVLLDGAPEAEESLGGGDRADESVF